jgi:uncharacterized membrane protein YqhA
LLHCAVETSNAEARSLPIPAPGTGTPIALQRAMAGDPDDARGGEHDSPFARLIGRSRLIVFVAVIAVLACAVSLFLLGGVLAADTIWSAWRDVIGGRTESTDLGVRFLEIVSVMLKAVFFYLIGVGLYSLFIAPLNVTVALGVETLNDLETKVISVIIVIMAVRFLERFIEGEGGVELIYRAVALSAVTAALVFFKIFAHREGQEFRREQPRTREHAKREMFEREHERHDIGDGEIQARAGDRVRDARRR